MADPSQSALSVDERAVLERFVAILEARLGERLQAVWLFARAGLAFSSSQHRDLRIVPARAGQSGVAGDESALERFGERHIGGVVSGKAVAKLKRPATQTIGKRPALDGQVIEVGQQIRRSGRAEMTTECEPPERRDDLEVKQRGGVEILARELRAQLGAPSARRERVDHSGAVDDDQSSARCSSCASRSARSASTTSSAPASTRSARRAARSRTSATVGRAASRSSSSSR